MLEGSRLLSFKFRIWVTNASENKKIKIENLNLIIIVKSSETSRSTSGDERSLIQSSIQL